MSALASAGGSGRRQEAGGRRQEAVGEGRQTSVPFMYFPKNKEKLKKVGKYTK
jgi:hypothetical protein